MLFKMERRVVYLETMLLTFIAVISAVSCCSPSDRAALLAFKAGLNEPYLGIFDSWTGTDCCANWHSVSCDPETGRVADISLRGESEDPILTKSGRTGYMTGTISPEICKLDRLTNFILADWKGISGEIPSCLTSLSSLHVLDLIGNRLTGKIPTDIGSLTRLTVLNLADNALTGKIPESIVSIKGLKHIDLSNNQLTGEIPVQFGQLKMLSRALLNRNRLTGPIPKSITSMDRLADLDLSMNQISDWIPDQIGKMRVLSTLNLDSNLITGKIPPTLLSSGMGILNLSRNALEGNIPNVFGPHSYFMALDLSFNNLKGPIPGSLSSAKYIGHLDMSHNHLCGAIPVGSPFDHLEASSFANNDCLCGNPLRTC
ncbi:hypothetical protein L484_000482 [Morus notabilis]|uniref:Leucine-rich repeat-containing N-terminal plant-type domain-containing protein n=1 Tax=Morus notabilis TaxID=981085 RepID=W9SDM9_9ROSA|nr:DNA damage-repair/toleration protein DRT100 [Morus notabilis]XP_024018105.1 DNA damage-repair/toleration protein DRT100 [Morus notabilis]XP_024018106.1 DNA damage-repair/toleration protein DRT100 [Morus notabilis]EXC36913.1 hypothetical protein L484_000482 [Morus notabilis]